MCVYSMSIIYCNINVTSSIFFFREATAAVVVAIDDSDNEQYDFLTFTWLY